MDTFQQIRPRLIEPGVKYFLSSSLEQCHILKTKYYKPHPAVLILLSEQRIYAVRNWLDR